MKANKNQIQDPAVQKTYTTEAAMHADQVNQKKGYLYVVTGVGQFYWKGTLTASGDDYEALGGKRTLKMLTSADMPYTLLESDKDKFLNFQDGGTVIVSGSLMSFAEGVIGVNASSTPLLFSGLGVQVPTGKLKTIQGKGSFSLWKSTYDPAFLLSGDLVTQEESILGTRLDASVSGTYAINLNSAALFNLTMTGNTDFTFANLPTGTNTKRFSVRLTGNFTFTFPAYCKKLVSDTYAGAQKNRLEFEVINGTVGSEVVEYRIENVPV